MEKAFTEALKEATGKQTGRPVGKSQMRAWTNSLSALARDLRDSGLGRIEVLVEYPMPHNRVSSADAVLAGINRHTGKDLFVVVELKQWGEAELYEDDEKLVVVPGSWNDHDTHPAIQVSNYCQQIIENCSAVDGDPGAVEGVAYLHNATRQSVRGLFELALDKNVRLFTMTERSAFIDYLRDRFEDTDGRQAAERLLNGRVQPNQPLLEKAANVLKGRDKFILVDQQQTAFETVRHAVPGEVGTLAAIKSYAQQLNVRHHHVSLEGQWRCGGSIAYDLWVRRLLGLGSEDGEWDGDASPEPWVGDENFEVVVARSPADMESILSAKLAGGWTARMTAGFCWPWSKPNPDKSLPPDVRIGDWERPWNANSTSKVGDAPPSQIWATSPGGFGQIGCVYTAQGLEFDWAGVIIGPDLLARGGRLVTEREGSKDRDLTRSTVTPEQFDRLIRNTYKVLLTRGLAGVVLYAVDPETQEFLSTLVNPAPTSAP
ncbi:DNA/RNA helicase domain-containing protein [Streptosporangium saharense]|uniref:DNA/RNA helicase domain-containing protein n=1 Tax=Streptosporangium saharense TaxID=1706840 RepID=UPI00332A3B2D